MNEKNHRTKVSFQDDFSISSKENYEALLSITMKKSIRLIPMGIEKLSWYGKEKHVKMIEEK